MKNNGLISWAGSLLSGGLAVVTELAPTAIEVKFASIMAGISAGVTIAYTLWIWYKRVTHEGSDGGKKITKEEIKEGIDELFGKDGK